MGTTAVIGAGVIGLMCAYELSRQGERVLVIDRGEPGMACSWGNAGWIVPSLSGPICAPGVVRASLASMVRRDSPLYIKPRMDLELARWLWGFWRRCNVRDYRAGLAAVGALNRATMPLYDALERVVDFEMHRAGLLLVFLGEAAMEHAVADLEQMRPYGYALPTVLDQRAVRDLEPGLSRDVIGGVLIEQERHVRPDGLTTGLVAHLRRAGVDLRPNTAVTGFRRSGPAVAAVDTDRGRVEAERFLVAAGAWSGTLLRQAGFPLPIQAAKGYSVTVEGAPGASTALPLYLGEAKVACTPFRGAFRMGGTLELSGLDSRLDARRVRGIRRGVERYLPGRVPGQGGIEWVGARPVAPDGLPVIGRIPEYDNLYVATGHGMLGVTLAPATALAISELIRLGCASVDLTAFDPARFARGRRTVA
jgi:D-amino-acid dehydrogenase